MRVLGEKQVAIRKKQKEEREKQKKLESQGLKQKGKAKKKKGIRIRKGVQIRGIKVVDSETKNEVKRILQEEKEAKMELSD